MDWRATGRSLLAGKALPWLAAFVLAVVAVMQCGKDSEGKVLSEETRAEWERTMSEAVRKAFKERDDSLGGLSRASIDTSRLRAGSARETRGRAEDAGREADARRRAVDFARSLADSLKEMTAAYDARTRERDSISTAFDQMAHANLLSIRAAELANERADAAVERVRSLEALNARIMADIEKAEKGCRILGLVKCPSRKASFALGVGVGAAAGLVATVAVK